MPSPVKLLLDSGSDKVKWARARFKMATSLLGTLSSLTPKATSLTRPGVDEADGGRDDDDGAEHLHLDHTPKLQRLKFTASPLCSPNPSA